MPNSTNHDMNTSSGRRAKLAEDFSLARESANPDPDPFLDLSKNNLNHKNPIIVNEEISKLHLYAHYHDPRFAQSARLTSNDQWQSLNSLIPRLIQLIRDDNTIIAHNSGHLLWHTPNGFEELCKEFNYEPETIITELRDWLDLKFGRQILEHAVSPESGNDLAKEYAFQCLLFLLIDKAGGCYLRPVEMLDSAEKLPNFLQTMQRRLDDVSRWVAKAPIQDD